MDAADARRGGAVQKHTGPVREKAMTRHDFILTLVFPYKPDAMVRSIDSNEEEQGGRYREPTSDEKQKMDMWRLKRESVITKLSDSGLILMLFYSRDRDEIFVKVAADEMHLKHVAEMKQHKLELKPEYLSAFCEYRKDYTGQREVGYSNRILVSHLYKAHVDTENGEYPRPDAIFRTVDKIHLIDYIIRESGHNCAGVDINTLRHDGDLTDYFFLHENRKLLDMNKDWFRCFASGAHIDKVRDYFGERVAFYFLFMSFFNMMLIPAAIAGVFFWIFDLFFGTPDNFPDVLFMLFMGFWSIFFAHMWRRQAAQYAMKWGTLGLGLQEEQSRPDFHGESRINPVTGRIDRFYPWSKRIRWVALSYVTLFFVLAVLMCFVAALFVLRKVFHEVGGRYIFQVVNAISVDLINMAFTRLAQYLTELENHRTETERDTHLLAKTVVFKFINCYCSLYYIAFFKEHGSLFGMQMSCADDDCMKDLGSQLAIFMFVRLIFSNGVEVLGPMITAKYREVSEGRQFHSSNPFKNPSTSMPDLSTAEKQAKKEECDIFDEMDETLMTYGYTTLFVVACPWVPLLSLFSNVIESFLDAKKLILFFRRPYPVRVATNEPWDTAFDVFGILAMSTNLAIVVLTSKTFQSWTHAHKIILFLTLEHLIIFVRILIGVFYPAVQTNLKRLQAQQRVIVHRHLDLGGEEDDHETRASAMRTSNAPAPWVFERDEDDEDQDYN